MPGDPKCRFLENSEASTTCSIRMQKSSQILTLLFLTSHLHIAVHTNTSENFETSFRRTRIVILHRQPFLSAIHFPLSHYESNCYDSLNPKERSHKHVSGWTMPTNSLPLRSRVVQPWIRDCSVACRTTEPRRTRGCGTMLLRVLVCCNTSRTTAKTHSSIGRIGSIFNGHARSLSAHGLCRWSPRNSTALARNTPVSHLQQDTHVPNVHDDWL